ncbi:acyl-CoA dehydrogenase family protein [Actinoplanes sp. NBRC 103695]|uniref:acyl-CoA dehydrogenase family protein n=1 Tax=Actinoplanes sp. NBRC 103695 TaxID=3032202 RepID=UPI0024A0F915|nr:acyl-CoA dehydrogenase family protein [Actinoplanes sp. NBRC 103695]GLZ00716.1 hydrolase [Actinoplanes sp. NBRC 103695]
MIVDDELTSRAAAAAIAAEERRTLDSAVVADLRRAGFARHFAPASLGGDEGSFAELVRGVATLGAACPATAWCASLTAHLGRMVAFLPPGGQREIWAGGDDPLLVGSLASFGAAVPVDGGWTVSGRWPYISGIDHAGWALLCATLPDDEPARVFALPVASLTADLGWDIIGMRATGSHNVTVTDVFVPEARTFARDDLLAGRPASSVADCHRTPLEAANLLSFAAPLLGAAEGALGLWTAYATAKAAAWNPTVPSASTMAITLARTSGEIDAARLLLERAADVCDRGAAVTPDDVARNTRDISLAAEILTAAVNRLAAAAGTSGLSQGQPMQRFWRDANTIASHIALRFEMAALGYAEGRLWEPGKAPGSMLVGADW